MEKSLNNMTIGQLLNSINDRFNNFQQKVKELRENVTRIEETINDLQEQKVGYENEIKACENIARSFLQKGFALLQEVDGVNEVKDIEEVEVKVDVEDSTLSIPIVEGLTDENPFNSLPTDVELTGEAYPQSLRETEKPSTKVTTPVSRKPKKGKKPILRQPLTPFFIMMEKDYVLPEVKVSTKTLSPHFSSFCDEPTNSLLQIGNLQYKKEWTDPQETRVYDPQGISPCLTTVATPMVFTDGRNHNKVNPLSKVA